MGSEPPATRPTQVRWLICALACAVSWLLYLHRYSWGVVKPAFLRDNSDLTDEQVGLLDGTFMAVYAVGQIPGGLAGDILGPRRILSGVVLVWSVAVAGLGWTTGFWRLAGVRGALGLGQASAYPVLNRVTRNWFPGSIRTTVQGLVTALGRIGAACAGPIVATLLMGLLALYWRTALLVIAVPGVLLAVACWAVLRTSPREHPWANAAEQEAIEAGVPPPTPGRPVTLLWDSATMLNLGMLLLYAFASAFQDQLYVNWVPTFLEQGRGLSTVQMGLLTALPFLGGAAGGIVGGVLNDMLLRSAASRRWVRSGIGFTGRFIAAGLVLLSVQVEDGGLAMGVLLVARFFGDWSLPTQWGTVTDVAGRGAGTVFGLVNTLGAVGGFAAGPALIHLKKHYDWDGLFLGVAIMCLVSALAWLFIDCTRRVVAD